eukprot:TRINITY_DN10150_c0_g4_i2.p1 TRINITY_DN10150_c0_g4~~TRINITY_DN10150_c0_g4_i2.p1  ORF type:complete len:646 (+),score=276.73 TRINITY_DN10150_c0_g4_i2:72-1940(+)
MSLSAMVVRDKPGRSFEDFGLDARLLQGLRDMRFKEPTLVQVSAIPLALAGKDILARASTGSGKTVAYAVPVCQKLLAAPRARGVEAEVRAVVLVPSRELSHQTVDVFTALLRHTGTEIRVTDVSGIDAKAWGGARPDIAVGTPATMLGHCRQGNFTLGKVCASVVDEADALIGLPAVRRLRCMYPTTTQCFLMSATLSPAVLELKKLLLNKPVVVRLEEEDEDGDQPASDMQQAVSKGAAPKIEQLYVPYKDDEERYCYLWSLIRLKHVQGKVLIFVEDVHSAYRVKLFLERFGVKAAVLNHDIPLNSRNHIISQFNTGIINFLVATDEGVKHAEAEARRLEMEREKEKKKKRKKDKKAEEDAAGEAAKGSMSEYNVSRGMDFREVGAVISFDSFAALSEDACKSYVHRIGRTGRAGKEGTAITFVTPEHLEEGGWLGYLSAFLEMKGQSLAPHPLCDDRAAALSLMYRTSDVLQSIRKKHLKEARISELAQEAVTSEKLKQHFSDNPDDLATLTHLAKTSQKDKEAAASLAFLPEYLGVGMTGAMEDVNAKRHHSDSDEEGSRPLKRRRRGVDPLQRAASGADVPPAATKKRLKRRAAGGSAAALASGGKRVLRKKKRKA